MFEQFLKLVGEEFTFTQSSVILLMVFLLFQERKDKQSAIQEKDECQRARASDAKEVTKVLTQQTDRTVEAIRMLDKILYKSGGD